MFLFHLSLAGLTAKKHEHGDGGAHREREADGAFSPRKHGEEGDEHDSQFDHEAILGSKKEAEEFDELPPEIAKQRLRELLTKMDRNKDEKIDKTELTQWIYRSFRMLNEEEAHERFDETDSNRDGIVTWTEYKKEEWDDYDEQDQGDRDDEDLLDDLAMIEEDQLLFSAADTNQDGFLTKEEFTGFSHPEGFEHMKPAVVQHVLKVKDKNKDGKISFQEYVGDRGKDKNKNWLEIEKERFDTDLDTNKDGSLEEAEIKNWIIPDDMDTAGEETNHLFAGSDDDHDGFLSVDEVLAHHDLFVGSEATDFGEHLHKVHTFQDEL